MGNIVHCCRILSNYFTCRDALTQNEPERSALLSSDDSDCDPASLSDNFEEDLSTVSTGVTNLTLEPENFLFPDIILSSSLGGDVTLVEPMVCLLVSEEGEVMRLDEGGGGRSRVFSEVETQTEAETWIGSQVQTQTEMLNEDLRQRDAETPGERADAAAWSGEVNRIVKRSNDANFKSGLIHKVQILTTPSADHTSQVEQSTEVHSNEEEQHTLPSRIERHGNKSPCPSVMLTEHANNLDHFTCVDETEERGRNGEQAGQDLDHNNTGTKPREEENVGQTVNQWISFTPHQENWQQLVDDDETPHQLTEEEEGEKVLISADVPVQADGGDCAKGGAFVFAGAFQSHLTD